MQTENLACKKYHFLCQKNGETVWFGSLFMVPNIWFFIAVIMGTSYMVAY